MSSVNALDLVATPPQTITYDRRGRRQAVQAGDMTTSFTYNDADQLLSEANAGGALNGLNVTRTFDSRLRPWTLSLNTQPASLSHT